MNVCGRDILIYMALKYGGQRNVVMKALHDREECKAEEVVASLSRLRCKVTTIFDADFPSCMKTSLCPPMVLFYQGDLNLIRDINQNIAIVGSRECNQYVLKYTREISNNLAERGYSIVSGLAKGVDTAALEAALPYGKAVAILGNGFNYCYPSENEKLQKHIAKNGLLISEYPPSIPPVAQQFPVRNRLIAAAGNITLVTSAKAHSGTLITAGFALECGRGVGCLPERVGEESVCNEMIKEGAGLVESADDVIDLINPHLAAEIDQNFLKQHYK